MKIKKGSSSELPFLLFFMKPPGFKVNRYKNPPGCRRKAAPCCIREVFWLPSGSPGSRMRGCLIGTESFWKFTMIPLHHQDSLSRVGTGAVSATSILFARIQRDGVTRSLKP